MKLLFSVLKGFFLLLLLLLVLFGLTLLAWWMQWPLITGLVILLGVAGLSISALAVRALLRWHDKRRFVRRVVEEEIGNPLHPTDRRLTDAWQEGMQVFGASPSRFRERFAVSQPWFLVLNTSKDTALFAPYGETVPASPESPLHWHFLSTTVLLTCPIHDLTNDEWKELLTKLVGTPLRGIIVLFSIPAIAQASESALATEGLTIRSKVQQLMLTMNRTFPVYVLAEGLESIAGMPDILEAVPIKDNAAILFGSNAHEAAHNAKVHLEAIIRDHAVACASPKGDMLKAVAAIGDMGDKLHRSVEPIFREIVHTAKPALAGVAFCARSEPSFLSGILTRVLPTLPPPPPVTIGLPFMAKTRLAIMAGWLLLLLGLAGLMGVNVLYQHDALKETNEETPSIAHDATTDALYKDMLAIDRLKKAEHAWHLPSLGLDVLPRAIATRQAAFTKTVYEKMLNPLIREYRTRLAKRSQMSIPERQEMALEIMWLANVASSRLRNKEPKVQDEHSLMLTTLTTSRWDPVSGRIIVNAIHWMADGEQVKSFAAEMRALLAATLSGGSATYAILTGEIDERYHAAKVCLSDYWTHIAQNDPTNVCVRPTYTTQGYKVFKTMLADVEALDDGSSSITPTTQSFRSNYFRAYAEQWVTFAKAFAKIRTAMQEGDVFVSYTDANDITDLPHFQALERLAKEIEPLRDAGKDAPLWLSTSLLVDVVVDIALFQHKNEATSTFRTLASLLTEAPDLLTRLRDETRSAKEAREMLQAAERLNTFFTDILSLLKIVANPEKSYTLAATWFGGALNMKDMKGKEQDGTLETTYANAKTQLEAIQAAFKKHSTNPSLNLVPGMLDFIAQGVTVQAARVLQDAWENDVLGSATALYRQDDVAKLFGEKGVVQSFVQARMKPFLKRREKALAPAVWGDIPFPFTNDALAVLGRAEMIAARPPEDTYYVELRSQPTLVNIDAKERANQTTLSLQCQDKTATLVNRNYPRNEKFQYTVKQCAKTTLAIDFPSFSLTRTYDTFTDFLREFQYGEQDFTADDFANAADAMEASGVKKVTVRILPDNVAQVLEKEGGELPTLPDRITYVW